jgi:hypothetical protein
VTKRRVGEIKGIARRKIMDITNDAIQVTQKLVLKTFFGSHSGMKRIIELSKPRRDRRIIISRQAIRADAIPTSSIEYMFAAKSQKKKPKPASNILLRLMKKEFLKRESWIASL